MRTFLLADVRGYTRYTAEHGDDAAAVLAHRLASLVGSTVPEFGGELLEVRGDETLCVFSSARQALRAAVELQRRLRAPVEGEPFPLGVGMGLDAGEAAPTDGGYRGAALNMAGRLVSLAAPGQILGTERLVGLAGVVEGVRWNDLKPRRLKGLDRPERIVEIGATEPIPGPPAAAAEHGTPLRRRIGLVGIVGVAVVAAVLVGSRRGNSAAAIVHTPPNSLAAIDPRVERVVADVPLNGTPESATAGFGKVWIGSTNGLISAVSPSDLHVRSQGTSSDPAFLTAGAGAVWSYDGTSRITELAPQTLQVIADRKLRPCKTNPALVGGRPPCTGGGVTVVGNEVWLGEARGGHSVHSGGLARYNANTLHAVGSVGHVATGDVATANGVVWSLGDGPGTSGMELDGVDTRTGLVIARRVFPSPISATGTAGVSLGAGYVWAAAAIGVLYRVDPNPALTSEQAVFPYRLPPGVTDVLAQPNDVWVSEEGGRVLDVDPFNGRLKHMYHLGHATPVALAAEDGRVWIALAP